MEICEHCGRLFLTSNHALALCTLEDQWGTWHEWLCSGCQDDLAQEVYEGQLVRAEIWGGFNERNRFTA